MSKTNSKVISFLTVVYCKVSFIDGVFNISERNS